MLTLRWVQKLIEWFPIRWKRVSEISNNFIRHRWSLLWSRLHSLMNGLTSVILSDILTWTFYKWLIIYLNSLVRRAFLLFNDNLSLRLFQFFLYRFFQSTNLIFEPFRLLNELLHFFELKVFLAIVAFKSLDLSQ